MDFNDFCDNKSYYEKSKNEDKFKNFNENLRKNDKKRSILSENNQNLHNFSKNIDSEGYENLMQKLNQDEIKQKIERYKNMSQSELMNELIKETNKQKSNGNLNEKKLQDIKNSMAEFMSAEEQKKLDDIIKILR